MAARLLLLNVMLCNFQHGGSLVLEGNMAHQFQIGGITFPCRAHDLKMAAHLLMLVRWLMMPKMGAHFILLTRWLMIAKMAVIYSQTDGSLIQDSGSHVLVAKR